MCKSFSSKKKKKNIKQSSEETDDIIKQLLLVKYYWIDGKLQRSLEEIAWRQFKGSRTFERKKDLLLEILVDIDLDFRKLMCCLTDNG